MIGTATVGNAHKLATISLIIFFFFQIRTQWTIGLIVTKAALFNAYNA